MIFRPKNLLIIIFRLLTWINKITGPNARQVSLESINDPRGNSRGRRFDDDLKDPKDARLKFAPAPGTYLVKYKGKLLYIERIRAKEENWQGPLETVKISTFGRDIFYFNEIIEECRRFAREERKIGVPIYMKFDRGDIWERAGHPRRKRALKGVILQNRIMERLFEDLEDFLESESWYLDCGIPYRRGYLFYGPPGGGKSSTMYEIIIIHTTVESDKKHFLGLNITTSRKNNS